MKNALIRDFSPETIEREGTKIRNIINAAILWVWLALTQGVHAKSDNDIVTVDINWNTFTYNLWNEDLLATCDKYMDKNEKLLEDCITWAETAMEAQEDLINAKLNESEIGLANSERELASSKRELASSNARLKNAQARNEQTKKDMNVAKNQMNVAKNQMNVAKNQMNVAKNQMNVAEKEANRVYKQERKKVLDN